MNGDGQPSLLEQLNRRQDEVLDQLDDLNRRVLELLEECLRLRGGDGSAEVAGRSPADTGQEAAAPVSIATVPTVQMPGLADRPE